VAAIVNVPHSRSSTIDDTIPKMNDDAGTAQARALLGELRGQLADISQKLDAVEERNRRAHLRGISRRDPTAGILRRELCEAHRLIDGLRRRFPDAVTAES
jgi:hypothetical protein